MIRLASFWNPKARLFVRGRRRLLHQIGIDLDRETRPVVWMHCASLGEFEQGRPILELIRKQYPEYALVLTFFSPSGYEVRKGYRGVDYVFYLPLDGLGRAKRFLDLLNPKLALFVKYEFWYFYLQELNRRKVPVLLFSAFFQEKQPFFCWYGALFRKMLGFYDQIFVQDENSVVLLSRIGQMKVTRSGDTRIDRSITLSRQPESFPEVLSFKQDKHLLIAGSTWPKDEAFLRKVVPVLRQNGWKLLLVPHEVDGDHLRAIFEQYGTETCFWNDTPEKLRQASVAVVQTVGHLAHLYQYADAVWIGGGFEKGIHNIIEPAVFGLPIFFGPNYRRFREAVELIRIRGALSLNNPNDFIALMAQPSELKIMGENAKQYVTENSGATQKIMNYLNEKYFSTNSKKF